MTVQARLTWFVMAVVVAILLTTCALVRLHQKTEARIIAQAYSRLLARNQDTQTVLAHLLSTVPQASLARVNLIHGGFTLDDRIINKRLDQGQPVLAAGIVGPVAPPQLNVPLSQYSSDIGDLLADQCTVRQVDDLDNIYLKSRLQGIGMVYSIGCPLLDNDVLYGIVFLSWYTNSAQIPTATQLPTIIEAVRVAAQTIKHEFIIR